MKIDLHTHYSERSNCAKSSEAEQLQSAIQYGLNGVLMTDHNTFVTKEQLTFLREKHKELTIFAGIEVDIITKNNMEHILVIGVYDELLETTNWNYEDLYKFVRDRNGYLALAHPYRYSEEVHIDVEKYVPDAIEIHSTNIGRDDELKIKELAKRLNTRLIANSDSHSKETMGIFYNNLFYNVYSDEELVACLKAGDYSIGCDLVRIEEYNQKVNEREELIKQIIKDGNTAMDYQRITGNWTGQFDRVANGRSYEI